MTSYGVRGALLAIVIAMAVTAAPASAATRPHWDLTGFSAAVTMTGSAPAALTCADVTTTPREEVLTARYRLDLAVDRFRSKRRVSRTPLLLRVRVVRTTDETVRVLTPNGAGGCTESTRECHREGTRYVRDEMAVTVGTRRVRTRMEGEFANDLFLPCAAQGLMFSDPVDTPLVNETLPTREFRRSRSSMIFGGQRNPEVTTGDKNATWRGTIRFARTRG